MEIRSEITGLDGNTIVITASDPKEFLHAVDVLTQPNRVPMVAGIVPKTPVKQKRTYTKTNLGNKELQALIDLKRDGKSYTEIAKLVGVKYKTAWNKTHKVRPRHIVTDAEKLEILRKNHMKHIPVYHVNCPACQPWCGSTLPDWLTRSKQARIARLVEFRKNQNKNPQG